MKIMKPEEVERTTSLSLATIKKLAEEGLFPRPFKLNPNSNRMVYVEAEIMGWLASRAATRKPLIPKPTDVPLAEAMLCYNMDAKAGRSRVKVVAYSTHSFKDEPFDIAKGANLLGWDKISDRDKLHILLRAAWAAVTFNKVPISRMDDALRCIPEFRHHIGSVLVGQSDG